MAGAEPIPAAHQPGGSRGRDAGRGRGAAHGADLRPVHLLEQSFRVAETGSRPHSPGRAPHCHSYGYQPRRVPDRRACHVGRIRRRLRTVVGQVVQRSERVAPPFRRLISSSPQAKGRLKPTHLVEGQWVIPPVVPGHPRTASSKFFVTPPPSSRSARRSGSLRAQARCKSGGP